ncbi:MAG: phosphoglucosamine mutase [Actinomycetota bacterium]|nr:phosphoglucosamine mutase [Actinomycetota bacterium]
MGRLFGTDGVRGIANDDLTAELALAVSVAAAEVLGEAGASEGRRSVAVVGRDTRASGEFLEAAVVAGLASAGVDVVRLGVIPTPAVAFLSSDLGADLGVVISASHNPMPDNGIKFFSRGGHKLGHALEDAIEQRMAEPRMGERYKKPVGADVGRVRDLPEAAHRYVDHLVRSVQTRYDGLTVVIDAAHGAAFAVAPIALRALGAEVITIAGEPDGLNINDGCGSTHLGLLQAAVTRYRADAGFALDGDADRCLAVDAAGNPIDGDQLLAVLAVAMRDRAALVDDTVVTTVMSNLGFLQAMSREKVTVQLVNVGDRYVVESMRAGGFNLGGEQSGHLIMTEHATTGDGLLAALHVLARMADTGASLQDLAAVMTKLPQVLINVSDVDKTRAGSDPVVAAAVAAAEQEMGERGRVLLRPSGTETLVRVMVEAESPHQAQRVAEQLAGVVRRRLAL